MRKHFLLFLLCITLASSNSYAQTYGNEWINFDQKYSKIRIGEEGIYKITYDDVIGIGFPFTHLDPTKFQLFNKGIEVPIYISGVEDGIFDDGDVIYFYGNKNNGSLDQTLYLNPGDLPNSEVSLFGDDNFYFFTYSNSSNGKRYQANSHINGSLTAESFMLVKKRINLSTNYYPGEYILDAMSLSEYTEGEGYLGSTFGKGESQSFQLNTSGFLSASVFQPTISFYVAGRSNASSTHAQGKNHHFKISSNSSPLFDSVYKGYNTIRKTIPIAITASSTPILVSSVDDLGATTDFQALGYLELVYGRSFNIAGSKNLNFNLPATKTTGLIHFTNASLTQPIVLEKNGNNIYFTPSSASTIQFTLSNISPTTNYYLSDLTLAKPVGLNAVSFKSLDPNFSKNYLIISNNQLSEGALAYQSYNESIGMPTALAYTDDIYNEFYFGFHHPMALRNYCQYMIEKGNVKPEYLLLLGKGYETPKGSLSKDLVPTMGFPASDNMLTSGFNGSNLEPGLNTGRIPAKTNTDILNYLEKLKTYNGLSNEIWRKKMLNISGGKSIAENKTFNNYQNLLFEKAKEEYLGASLITIQKNTSNPVTDLLTNQIVSETRKGAGLISYLGHGSSNTTEILLGEVDKLDNEDKPTVYLINGCSTGSVFNNYESLGEQFILQKKYGAVAWIGTTSEGVASYLNNASLNYYENWFKNDYGKSIATGIKSGLKNYQNPSDKLNLAHTRQYILLGDPYLKFYSPSKPDFSVDEPSIIIPPNQTASNRFFNVKIAIKNIGKAVNTKLPIKISRILPDNSQAYLPDTSITIFNTDSLSVSFDNANLKVSGKNTIVVEINKDNIIDESNQLNNIASKVWFLAGNSLKALFPLDKSIVQENFELSVQSENLFIKTAEYLFELDTTPAFNSNILKKSTIITGGVSASWEPGIQLEDNTVYYWRVRLNIPVQEGGSWVTSSFTVLKHLDVSGYNVAHFEQLEGYTLTNLTKTTPFGFNFRTFNMLSAIRTRGDGVPYDTEKRLRVDGMAISYAPLEFDGISILAFHPTNYAERFQYPSPYNYINPPDSGPYEGPSGQYIWDLNNKTATDSLLRYLKQIPYGYHIIGYNGHNAEFDKLPQTIKEEFRKLGITKLETVKKGEPYCFWVTKGDLESVKEVTADYSSSIPATQQSLNETNYIQYAEKSGSFVTDVIGPATTWSTIDLTAFSTATSNLTVDVIGIDSIGIEKQVSSHSNTNQIDISSLSAIEYPYIKLKYHLSSIASANMPVVKHIRVLFRPTPDISIDTYPNNESLQSDNLHEGDSIKWNLGIKNFGIETSDSLNIKYILTSGTKDITHRYRLPFILNPGELKPFSIAIPTLGLEGSSLLRVIVEQESFSEKNISNNAVSKTIVVEKDKSAPLLNISFDGKQIINGEIVSPTPVIRILSTDDNKFLLMTDTSLVEISIKKTNQEHFKRIYYSGRELSFTPSNSEKNNQIYVDYLPDRFEDGSYTLKIRSKDVSGNQSGNDYLIEFEVINKASITNFYPYPNPVTDKMKFVFTLTGTKVPDNIKIQILTPTGRIIKEISKAELGNIKIGSNITDFTWDCTDQFGDRLANGVYFYKVTIENKDKIEHRQSAGDKYFKHQIGKIYILK